MYIFYRVFTGCLNPSKGVLDLGYCEKVRAMETTLLALVQWLIDAGEPNPDEKALAMIQSGEAILTGNFKGHSWEDVTW